MRKLKYVMHISLDGYHADNNGGLQWVPMDDNIGAWVHEVVVPCDTVIYGRVTFQLMEAFWPNAEQHPAAATSKHIVEHARWVNPVQKIVFSRTLAKTDWQNTKIIREDMLGAVRALKAGTGGDILMLGSASIGQLLMSHGLIDDYYMTIAPVTLGAGQSLFHQPLKLKLISTVQFPNGAIGAHYVPA